MEFYQKRLLTFKPALLKSFFKMILGVTVQISKELREDWNKENLGRWFFIISINSNETVNICSLSHQVYSNASLKDLKL